MLCMAGVYLYCFIQVYKSFIYILLLFLLILYTCYSFMVQFKLLLDISSSSDWGGIQLVTPESAVGLAIDCALRLGADPMKYSFLVSQKYFTGHLSRNISFGSLLSMYPRLN